MNICSVIVNCKPKNSDVICQQLTEFEGVDIFGGQEDGKLIVTIEASGERSLSEVMTDFKDIPGVIDASMVYHQEESDDKLEEILT